MAGADYVIKQGDTGPAWTYTLTDDDGTSPNLTGATGLALTLRSHSANSPLTLAGTASVTTAASGIVKFVWAAADTAVAGLYQASWKVTLTDGTVHTYPRTGYLWVSIEENLTTMGGATLVSLPDAKDYLNIPATDRSHDAKLMRFITAVRPVVEHITGPIIPTVYREFHDGGHHTLKLRRRPSTAFGTDPILDLVGVTEWRGPIAYALSIVQDPASGSIYSCTLDPRLGIVTRRTAGGGVTGFPQMPESVYVVYRAGQNSVPANVYEGTLELIRLHYQRTQQSGRSRAAAYADDDEPTGAPVAFLVPGKVRELLTPTKRAPSVA